MQTYKDIVLAIEDSLSEFEEMPTKTSGTEVRRYLSLLSRECVVVRRYISDVLHKADTAEQMKRIAEKKDTELGKTKVKKFPRTKIAAAKADEVVPPPPEPVEVLPLPFEQDSESEPEPELVERKSRRPRERAVEAKSEGDADDGVLLSDDDMFISIPPPPPAAPKPVTPIPVVVIAHKKAAVRKPRKTGKKSAKMPLSSRKM